MTYSDWHSIQLSQLKTVSLQSVELRKALAACYSYHREIGFISDDLLQSVTTYTQIPLPDTPFHFHLQFNPERARRGRSDRVHPSPQHSIDFQGGIPCFCCPDVIQYQWPEERGFEKTIRETSLIFLPNPSPIFSDHFTIVSAEHRDQVIDIPLVIETAVEAVGYWVVENDRQVGATNPWHFHLQAFLSDDLPIIQFPSHPIPVSEHADFLLLRLQLPTPVFEFRFDPSDTAAIEKITTHCRQYVDSDPNHRLTVLCRVSADACSLFVSLRDIRHRSSMYPVGQPGYAEVAGVISVISQDRFLEWSRRGAPLFNQILSEIAPDEAVVCQWLHGLAPLS